MVTVTPEEFMAGKRAERLYDEMTEVDRDIIGRQGVRIDIPVCDIYNLRRIAGILAGLSAELDGLSRRGDLRQRTIWLEVRATAKDVNQRIREMTGKGKTPKPYRSRQQDN